MILTFPSPAETVLTINLFGFAAVVGQLVHPLLSQQLVPLGLYQLKEPEMCHMLLSLALLS